MAKKLILSAFLGAIILFFWGMASWMFLPWHAKTMNSFKDEAAVAQVITANAEQSGIYAMPKMGTQQANVPMMFVSVDLKGLPANMNRAMGFAFVAQFLAALFVSFMVSKTNLNYAGRVGFVVLFALSAGLVSFVPDMIWHHFSMMYTKVMLADLLISWFLAGLVIAKLSAPKAPRYG